MSKLMIKATLGNDIRRVSIHNEELTYDELILMLQRVFRGKLSNDDEILLKYKDEDDDLITISDCADLAFALGVSPVLKLTLLLNGASQEEKNVVGLSGNVDAVKNELRQIRDRVNKLLDYLDDNSHAGVSSAKKGEEKESLEMSNESGVEPHPMNGEQSKEFDPLQGKSSQEDSLPPAAPTPPVTTEPTSIVPPPSTSAKDPKGPPTVMQQQPNEPPLGMQPGMHQQYAQPRMSKSIHTSAYPQHPSMMPMNMYGPPRSNLPSTPPVGNPTTSAGALGPPPTGPTTGNMSMQRIPNSSVVYPPPMAHGMQPGQTPGMQPGQTPGMQPGQTPGMQPGQTPGMQPGQAPGMQPGQAPGMQPGQTPGGYNPYYKPCYSVPSQPGYK